MRKMKMGALLAMLGGSTLFGGCLGGWWQAALRGLPVTLATEFLLDNDGFVDLFDDGDRDTDADGTLDNDGDN